MEVFDHIFQTGHSRTDIADDNDDFVIAFDAWQSEGKEEGNRGLYIPVSPSNLLLLLLLMRGKGKGKRREIVVYIHPCRLPICFRSITSTDPVTHFYHRLPTHHHNLG
jgi:hypothetical protein